jgi:hypothetical protein
MVNIFFSSGILSQMHTLGAKAVFKHHLVRFSNSWHRHNKRDVYERVLLDS